MDALTGDAYKKIDRSVQLGALKKALLNILTEADLPTFLNAPEVEILQEPAFPSIGPAKRKKKPPDEANKQNDGPRTTIRKNRKKRMKEVVLQEPVPVDSNGLEAVNLTVQPSASSDIANASLSSIPIESAPKKPKYQRKKNSNAVGDVLLATPVPPACIDPPILVPLQGATNEISSAVANDAMVDKDSVSSSPPQKKKGKSKKKN